MSRAISELLPDVMLATPGCPPMVATQALSSALREFLMATEAWKVWAAATDVVADQATYSWANHLNDPAQAQYIALKVNALRWTDTGAELVEKTHAQLQALDPEWRTRTAATPSYWTHETQTDGTSKIRLYPIPDTAVTGGLQPRLVIVTHTYAGMGATANDDLAVSIPDELFHRYRDVIVDGALFRLYRIPGRDWTDKGLSRDHFSLFQAGMVAAKSEADNDFTTAVHTVAYGGY